MRLCVSGAIVLATVFLVSVMARAFPVSEELGAMLRRAQRGFRDGAADRIAHGFGKRSPAPGSEMVSPDYDDVKEYIATDEMLADALHRDVHLALRFVRTFVDTNDDGFITDDEMI